MLKSQVKNNSVKILPGICCYNAMYPSNIDEYVAFAESKGIKELMMYEADALARYNLTTTVRAINLDTPNYKRVMTAYRVNTDDIKKINWESIPEHTEFLFDSGKKMEHKPSEKTSVQIAYNDHEVMFKFTCHDANMDVALAPATERPEVQYYLDALGPRSFEFYINSCNLFLDPQHTHQDYFNFGLTPKNETTQQTFVKEDWMGEWEQTVDLFEGGWVGIFRIPFSTLNVRTPTKDDTWGINIIRGIRAKEETNIWFYKIWTRPFPADMGHLQFN